MCLDFFVVKINKGRINGCQIKCPQLVSQLSRSDAHHPLRLYTLRAQRVASVSWEGDGEQMMDKATYMKGMQQTSPNEDLICCLCIIVLWVWNPSQWQKRICFWTVWWIQVIAKIYTEHKEWEYTYKHQSNTKQFVLYSMFKLDS